MTNLRAYLDLSLAMILVGSSLVVSKVIVTGFSVFLASELRFAIASMILIPMLLRAEGGLASVKSISRRVWLILFLQAFTGVFLFAVLLMYGLKTTSAAENATGRFLPPKNLRGGQWLGCPDVSPIRCLRSGSLWGAHP